MRQEIELGVAAHVAGDLSSAAAHYLRALELDPDNFTALYNLALVRQVQGSLAESEDLYRRSLVSNPDYGPSLFNLALLLADVGRWDESEPLIARYVTLNPDDAHGHYRWALALHQLGLDDEASEQMELALALDPSILDLPSVSPSPTPPALVVVPDVVGRDEAVALALLRRAGLSVGERTEQTDTAVEPGLVIATNPRARISVARGTSIDYVVSAPSPLPPPTASPSPEGVVVPDLVAMDVAEAQTAVDAIGLLLDISWRETLEVPPDTVVEQSPSAGEVVSRGTRISVTVSRMPSTVAVPRLTGMSEADAIGALMEAGLAPGSRDEERSTLPAGVVTFSVPAAGGLVAPGDAVDYVVSLGPRQQVWRARKGDTARRIGARFGVTEEELLAANPELAADPTFDWDRLRIGQRLVVPVPVSDAVPMVDPPDVRGMAITEARSTLESLGLHVRVRHVPRDAALGVVLSQFPTAAGRTPAGGTVWLSVAAAGDEPYEGGKRIQSDARGTLAGDALRFGVFAFDLDESSNEVPGTLIAQDVAPGSRTSDLNNGTQAFGRMTVPDVVGMDESDAVTVLARHGFVATQRRRSSESVPAGRVIATDPKAGTSDHEDIFPVTYTVSTGPKGSSTGPGPVDVPDMTGRPADEVLDALALAGVWPDVRTRETFGTPPGTVLSMTPTGSLARGSLVEVVVASAGTTVPDYLYGSPFEDARTALEGAGLVVGTVRLRFCEDVVPGHVLASAPKGGTRLTVGTPVDLTICRGPQS